ncbi:MAG: replication initiation protein [Saprospiraceae bacterium]
MATKTKRKNKGILLIKKSNNLIESRYKFDIWETRFFLSVLSQIRREDEDFEMYRIWYKDVIKTFGLRSGDSYHYLREAAKSLMGKSFYVKYEGKGANREKQYHILREIDYLQAGEEQHAPTNEEYIDVMVEQKMKPFLLQLQKNFTAYDLRNIVKLGVYPVRVYELLKQYQVIGKRTLGVAEMKEMFEVKDKYNLFADFNRWVIKPAVKEINAHTDLEVTKVEKIKQGRKVSALRFEFRLKNRTKSKIDTVRSSPSASYAPSASMVIDITDSQVPSPSSSPLDQLFAAYHSALQHSFGVTPSKFLQALKSDSTIDAARIEKAMRVTRRANTNGEIKKSAAGFFMMSLREEYTDSKEEAQVKARKLEQRQEAQRLQLHALEIAHSEQINNRIRSVLKSNPTITNQAIAKIETSPFTGKIIQQKVKSLDRPLTLEDYRADVQLRELVKTNIMQLAVDQFEDLLMNYEQQKLQILQTST